MRTTKQTLAALAVFAALAPLATSPPAAANHHVREYVVPFIPGEGRNNYSNVIIMVSNPQPKTATISMKAYVNRDSTAQSCDSIPPLEPYEIRRFARHSAGLCVSRGETKDFSLRIRTIEGVLLSGFIVLNPARGWSHVPMVIASVEPDGPDGITFSSLTLDRLASGDYRLSVALGSSSGLWPYTLRACVQTRMQDAATTELFDDPSHNCGLSNEQVRGWGQMKNTMGTFLNINTESGSQTSATASFDYERRGGQAVPLTYRVCISRHDDDDDVVSTPFMCRNVVYTPPAAE